MNITYCSSQVVHCVITSKGSEESFACSILYASNDAHIRKMAWKDFLELRRCISGSWMIIGDFNCVLKPDERIGSIVIPSEYVGPEECMLQCGLNDIQSTGNLFTWNNKQEGDQRVFCKLDKAMINQAWLDKFPKCSGSFYA